MMAALCFQFLKLWVSFLIASHNAGIVSYVMFGVKKLFFIDSNDKENKFVNVFFLL